MSDDDQRPADPIFVDFTPYGTEAMMAPAAVVAWLPARPDGTGDVAVLEPQVSSDAVEPAPLCGAGGTAGHRFSARGFPSGHGATVLATGVIVGLAETERVQLQADDHGFALDAGFCGAPIWDEAYGAIIGVITARDHTPGTRTGYGVPVEALRRYWPSLPGPYVVVRLEIRNPEGRMAGEYPLISDYQRRTPTIVGRRQAGFTPPDIVLEPDPSNWVSRYHCRLDCSARRWRLTDTSTNGTFVRRRGEREPTRVRGAIDLRAGDIICIRASSSHAAGDGHWELEFHDPHHTADIADHTAASGQGCALEGS